MAAGLRLAVLIVAGLLSGLLGSSDPLMWCAWGVGVAASALLFPSSQARSVVLFAAVFLSAGTEGAHARDAALANPLQSWFRAETPDGRAQEPAMVHGVLASDAFVTETGIRLVIDVDWIRDAHGVHPIGGRLQAHVSGELAAAQADRWTAGRRIDAPVLLREPQTWWNPGRPSARWQSLHRVADLVGTIKSGTLVNVEAGRWWDEAAARIRRRVRHASAQFVSPQSAQSAAIVTAILIGDRAGLDEDVQRRLRLAGTYHVIAISGGNVAILTSIAFFALRFLVRSFRVVALVTIVFVVTYGWIVGDEPSVRRAVLAAVIYLVLSLAGLRPRALSVLALAAILIAAADPLAVIDPGAWLSFGASLGIILGATRFARWTLGERGDRANTSRFDRTLHAARVAVVGLFSATLAAELTLMPISAALFGRVGVVGLVLNFVAIPAMTAVQLAGIALVACGGWFDAGAQAAGRIAHLAASALVGSSMGVDDVPWLIWRTPAPALGWTAAYYAGLAVFVGLRGWSMVRTVAAAASACSLLVIVSAPFLERGRPGFGHLRVAMLDVGQGDAIAVQFPDGHAMLVDAGGAPGAFDVGGRVVTPALWALGVRRLDWLALTHPDTDHIGGALAVAADMQPREIWEGVPVPTVPEMAVLRQYAHDRRIAWRQLLEPHALELGSVVVDVLNPPAPDWERRRVRNDDSLVFRIRLGNVEVLLTGDAGMEFERRFSAGSSTPRLRLLKVGHHGSRTSSSERFVREYAPHAALFSAGRANLFGHPAPEVLARFDRENAVVFRTDRDGAVIVDTDGARVEITTMSGRHWLLTNFEF